MAFLCVVLMIGLVAPWPWLLRGVVIFMALMTQLAIYEAQMPCGDWGCGLAVIVIVLLGVVIGVFLLLRYLLIWWYPPLGMSDVGARWLWFGDFCVAAALGAVPGFGIFIWLVWALAGIDADVAHWGLGLGIAAIFLLAIWVAVRWGAKQSGFFAGIAVMLSIGLLQSLWFPETVLKAAQKTARGEEYCIYFPQSDRFSREFGALTLLSMEKSTNAHRNRHAILVWEQRGKVATAFWSYGQQRFVQGYQYGVHPVPLAMETRFRACLARRS